MQEKLFAQVVTLLEDRGLLLKKGTIVDSSIIAAPSSTRNRERKRDPDAHQTKKGNAERAYVYAANAAYDNVLKGYEAAVAHLLVD